MYYGVHLGQNPLTIEAACFKGSTLGQMPLSREEVCLFLKRIKRQIIPTRGVVGNDDASVSNPEKHGFGRAAESI